MRAVTLFAIFLLLSAVTGSGRLVAQSLRSETQSMGSQIPGQLSPPQSPTERLTAALQTQSAPFEQGPTWKGRFATAVGGAVLGAWVGYFASQVVTGDWEDAEARQAVNRPAWATAVGGVGFALGLSFPVSWGKNQGPPLPPVPGIRRSVINEEDLRRLGSTDAYDAVEVLRPEWFHDRGARAMGDTPADGMYVYVDGTRMGNLSTLRNLGTHDIHTIQLLDATAATLRWGAGNSRGAILVTLKG